MLRLIRYWLNCRAHPNRADYLSMGLGIEARHGRAKSFWAQHLALTKRFAARALADLGPVSSVNVLGAGRLLDVALEDILRGAEKVALFDADPGVLSFWKREAARLGATDRVEFRVMDLTGVIDDWTAAVEENLRADNTGRGLYRLLSNLAAPRTLDIEPADFTLSVNLLSQLSIYFRDRVSERCRVIAGIETDDDGRFPGDLQLGLELALKSLQIAHFSIIDAASTKGAAIITDESFYYYKNNIAPWIEEPALLCELPRRLGSKEIKERDSWLWHIAPQGVEDTDYGSIHKVQAVYYRA